METDDLSKKHFEMLTIEHLNNAGGDEEWEYASRNPQSLLYATPRFMTLIANHLGAQPGWLVAKRRADIAGLLPFMRKEGPLGPVFNSLAYYGSNGGVIQENPNEEAKAVLIDAFYKMAMESNAGSATIITNPLFQDSDFFHKHTKYDFRDERIGQITHFSNVTTSQDLLASFNDPRPRNIRRALREGIIIERCQDFDAIDFLYKTHVANMDAINGLAKQRDFFDLLPRIMNVSDWAIYIAKLNKNPIAALLVFFFNRTVEYFTPVVLEEYRSKQPLSLIIYKAMLDAIEKGFSNWNWGGTWLSQSGVYDFKKRWATTDYPYYYYTQIFNTDVKLQRKETLLTMYPGFYVLPFSELAMT
jgi:hypothetical protein